MWALADLNQEEEKEKVTAAHVENYSSLSYHNI